MGTQLWNFTETSCCSSHQQKAALRMQRRTKAAAHSAALWLKLLSSEGTHQAPCASQPHFRQLPGDAPGSQSTETLGETRRLTCPLRAAKQGAVTFLLLQGFLVIFSKIYSGAFYFSTLTRHCLPRVVEMSHLNTKGEHSQIQNVSIYTWKNYDLKRWEDRPRKDLESSCFIIF